MDSKPLNDSGLPQREAMVELLLEELRAMGGEARPAEMYQAVAARLGLTDAQREARDKRGEPLLESSTRFARYELHRRGNLDDSQRGVWRLRDELLTPPIEMGVTDPATIFPEGAVAYTLHRDHERNATLVRRAKETQPLICAACDFDFGKAYGDAGKGYIECHHTLPVAELEQRGMGGTSLEGVLLLCANCHRMAHYNFGSDSGQRRLLGLEELKALVKVRFVG